MANIAPIMPVPLSPPESSNNTSSTITTTPPTHSRNADSNNGLNSSSSSTTGSSPIDQQPQFQLQEDIIDTTLVRIVTGGLHITKSRQSQSRGRIPSSSSSPIPSQLATQPKVTQSSSSSLTISPSPVVDSHPSQSQSPSSPSSSKPQQSPESSMTHTRELLLIGCITFTTILSAMGNQGVLMSLPSVGQDLGFVESELQWVVNAYTLTYGCFLLLSGRIADIFGRKRCYILGNLFFALWTLVGGFSKNKYMLLVFRALAGIGASLSVPSAIGIIAQNFQPGPMRTLAYACLGGGAPIGGSIGVTLGGILTQYSSWRAIYWLISGIALIPAAAAFWIVPDIMPSKDVDLRIDWVGAATSLIALVLLLFVLSDASTAPKGWTTPYILALLIISLLLLGFFIWWQNYIEHTLHRPPLMRLALFTRGGGKLGAVYAVVFLMFGGFISFLYLADLYLQQYAELDPIHTAVRFLPTGVSGIACNILVGLLARVIPGNYLICLGALGTALANLLWAVMPADTTYFTYQFFGMILCVFGADFCIAPNMIYMSKLVHQSEQSTSGALFQVMTQIGGTFGTTICTIVYTTVTRERAAAAGLALVEGQSAVTYPKGAFEAGLRAGFWCSSAFNFAALIVAAIALRKMGRVEDKRPKAGAVGKATPDVAVEDGAIAQVEKRPGIEKENDLARDRDLEEVDLEEKK